MPHAPIQNSCWEEEKKEKNCKSFLFLCHFHFLFLWSFVTQMVLCRYPGQVYGSLFLSNNIQCVIWFEFKKSFCWIQTCITFVVDFGQLRITVYKILQDIWTSPSILSCLVPIPSLTKQIFVHAERSLCCSILWPPDAGRFFMYILTNQFHTSFTASSSTVIHT